jgi:hypothetical protein
MLSLPLSQPAQVIENCWNPLHIVSVRPSDDTRYRLDKNDARDILNAHMQKLADACLGNELNMSAHRAYMAFVSKCIEWGDAHNDDSELSEDLEEWMRNETEVEQYLNELTDDVARYCVIP